ncbi:hypothetical protein ACLMJK_008882 [Lecanora helva]
MAPLSAAQIVEHPEYQHVIWDLKPLKKGKVSVAKGRGGPIQIAYEIHGNGPTKIVPKKPRLFDSGFDHISNGTGRINVIRRLGLRRTLTSTATGTLKSAWQRQTKDFGHGQNTNRDQSNKYSCLIFDNRGIGESEKPLARYTTSEMAKDTLELIDDIGWTASRQLHIVGVSMGGMIAQELALMVPNKIASLSLVSTGPSIPKSIDAQLADVKTRMFTEEWLNQADAEGHFPTNGDRFAAQEVQKRQDINGFTRKGFLCQIAAAAFHHKSAKQLEDLGDKVGRQRIMVVHGTADNMITPPHGEVLCKELGGEERGVTKVIVQGRGHGLPMDWRKEFTKLIGGFVEKTQKL